MANHLHFHVKAICGEVSKPSVYEPFVDRQTALLKKQPEVYVLKMKELSLILKNCILGNFNFEEMQLKHWPLIRLKDPMSLVTYDGLTVKLDTLIKDDFVMSLIKLKACKPTIFILSGMLKLHTLAMKKEPGQAERDAIRKEIVNPFCGRPEIFSELRHIRPLVRNLIRNLRAPPDRFIPIWSTTADPLKGSFCITSSGEFKSAKRDSLLAYNLDYILRSPQVRELYNKDPDTFIAYAFTGVKAKGSSIDFKDYPLIDDKIIPLGRIIALPEPGIKFRVVNQPHLLLNSLSVNLGEKLKRINSSWVVQGVYSHSKCVEDIRQVIIDIYKPNDLGPEIHSIDLKNFTDRFPYKGFQSVILDELVLNGFISKFDKSVMDFICEAKYLFLDRDETIAYGVGTPQGTYPSFPLASMANGMLLYLAATKVLGRDVLFEDIPGRIIGDDTVIWNTQVADLYCHYVEGLGVEISRTKSIQSRYCAEMCSKIIHHLGIFEQKKLIPIDTVSSFISNFEYYGDALIELSSESQSLICELRQIPKPYGLGRDLSELLKSQTEMTYHEELFLTYYMVNLLKDYIPEALSTSSDFEIISARQELLPKIKIGETTIILNKAIKQVSIPIFRSLVDELRRCHKDIPRAVRIGQDADLRARITTISKSLVYLIADSQFLKRELKAKSEYTVAVCTTENSVDSMIQRLPPPPVSILDEK